MPEFKLLEEEHFGPVLPVIKFSDPEDALARAEEGLAEYTQMQVINVARAA